MEPILSLIVAAIVLAVLAAAAVSWGVDSRDGSDDPRRPRYPIGLG